MIFRDYTQENRQVVPRQDFIRCDKGNAILSFAKTPSATKRPCDSHREGPCPYPKLHPPLLAVGEIGETRTLAGFAWVPVKDWSQLRDLARRPACRSWARRNAAWKALVRPRFVRSDGADLQPAGFRRSLPRCGSPKSEQYETCGFGSVDDFVAAKAPGCYRIQPTSTDRPQTRQHQSLRINKNP